MTWKGDSIDFANYWNQADEYLIVAMNLKAHQVTKQILTAKFEYFLQQTLTVGDQLRPRKTERTDRYQQRLVSLQTYWL